MLFPPPFNRFPNSFGHIFGGGYAAGYYSYKWAEVLSADAFSCVRGKAACSNPDAGARFRDEILAVGGSRPAAESFRAFRGREPNVEALLRHNGMIPAQLRAAEARHLERQFTPNPAAAPARLAGFAAAGRDVPAGDEDRGP